MQQFNTPLDGALYLVGMGMKVFPCMPNEKMPVKGLKWKDWAEQSNKERVLAYGNVNPDCNWAVSCGPSNLVVLDIDLKVEVGKEKNGYESLKSLPSTPKTFAVETPSGGMHLYYSGKTTNSVGDIGAGLDTRSVGGYVIAPGSRNKVGSQYIISDPAPISQVPTWIPARLQEKKKKEVNPNTENFLDAFEEGGRNNGFTKLAGHLRALGFDKELILNTMVEVNEQLSDPLPESELNTIAWSMAKKAPGNALADAKAIADFAQFAPEDQLKIHHFSTVNMEAIPPVKWILKNQFISGLVSILVSPGGLGKSLLSLIQAVSVATGKGISGDEVSTQGRVWIHNAEDGKHDLERRLAAISIHHKIPQNLFSNIVYTTGLEQKINLASSGKQGMARNLPEIERIKTFIKESNIVLWMIDPFIRMHTVDENSNEEMDVVMEILTHIAQETKCAIGIVHHTNKAGGGTTGDANASRGASAVVNATRIANTLRRMTEEEASKLREEGEAQTIPTEDAAWYICLDNAKANFQRPMAHRIWYKKKSVILPNKEEVGCLERIILHDQSKETREKARETERKALLQAVEIEMCRQPSTTMNALATLVMDNGQTDNLLDKKSHATVRRKIGEALAVRQHFHGFTLRIAAQEIKGRPIQMVIKEGVNSDFLQ